MPGNSPETPGNSLAQTTLTDRELLIHALQHLEVLTGQVGEIYGALVPLRPMLEKLANRRRMFP